MRVMRLGLAAVACVMFTLGAVGGCSSRKPSSPVTVKVEILYAGSAAEEMDAVLTMPLRMATEAFDGAQSLMVVARDGALEAYAVLDGGTDIAAFGRHISAHLDKASLPAEMGEPSVVAVPAAPEVTPVMRNEVQVVLKPERLALLGISVTDVTKALSDHLADGRPDPSALDALSEVLVPTASGALVPVQQIVTFRQVTKPDCIVREYQFAP